MLDLKKLASLLEEALKLVRAAIPAETPASPNPPGEKRIAWGARVNKEFKARIIWTAEALGFPVDWLMACMAFETGRSFSAKKKNPASSATGLIQFMRQTAIDLGTSVEHLASLKDEDQIVWVYRYFVERIKERGPITSLEDCYMAILWPAAIGKPNDHPLFINDINRSRDSYDVNAGLDANKDNKITKAEAAAKVRAMLTEGLKEENLG